VSMKTGYDLLLPQGMTDYFEVVEVEETDRTIILHLEEKGLSPSEVPGRSFISKGFYPAVDIHDFPIRDKGCILRVRRRRWQDKQTGNPDGMKPWNNLPSRLSIQPKEV